MKRKLVVLVLSVIIFFMCYPIIFLVTGSITGESEIWELLAPMLNEGNTTANWQLFPRYPTLRAYVELLLDTPEFFVMFWNSVKITLGTLVGQILIGIPAAWGFARYKIPWKKGIFFLYIAFMLMPFQIMMLSNYLVLRQLGILDSLKAVILPGVFSTFPVVIMAYFFEKIPHEVVEAARIDGANERSIFLYVGLPLGREGIFSILMLGFLECWNLIEQPLIFLEQPERYPLSLLLPTIKVGEVGIAFVASIIILIPALLIFMWGTKYIEDGISVVVVKE